MFTQRAVLLGFVAFCLYLIAVVNKLPSFYFALTWLTVCILVASLGITLLSLVGVDFRFEIVRSRASASLEAIEGEGPQIRVQMSNSGTFNKTGILLALGLRDTQKRLQVQHFVVEALPSGASLEVVLPLSQLPRGRYCLEDAHLTGSDVLGLFRVGKRFSPHPDLPRDIIVGPAVLRGAGLEPKGGGGSRGGAKRTVPTGAGEELRGTRPYAPGDDLRYVHWKSSARAGELVVKEFEQTGRSTSLVIWDGAAGTSWGVGDYNTDEWSLILCASLCYAFLSGATPCDFARLDEAPLVVGTRSLSNDQLPIALTEALAGACADRRVSLEAAAHETRLTARSYSAVIIVTASLADDVLQQARFWRSRGARVQVLLIDGAALGARGDARFTTRAVKRRDAKVLDADARDAKVLDASNLDAGRRQARGVRVPVQIVSSNTASTPASDAKKAARLSLAVTTQAYQAQAQRLRQEGFEVELVGPSADSPQPALRAALQETLLSRSVGRLDAATRGSSQGSSNSGSFTAVA